MKRLIAKKSILFEGRFYDIGKEVPTVNPKLVEAWIKNDVAFWKEEKESAAVKIDADGETIAIGGSAEDGAEDNGGEVTEESSGAESETITDVKAKLVTAEPGLSGSADIPSGAEDLVGKIPNAKKIGRTKA